MNTRLVTGVYAARLLILCKLCDGQTRRPDQDTHTHTNRYTQTPTHTDRQTLTHTLTSTSRAAYRTRVCISISQVCLQQTGGVCWYVTYRLGTELIFQVRVKQHSFITSSRTEV